MSLGPALDVAIGLVFTYLLLGILTSGVQELVAGFLKLRGKELRKGVAALLAGTDPRGGPDTELFQKVIGHALVEDLSPVKLPSYVPARNFSLAVVEALRGGSQSTLFSQIESSVARLPQGSAKESLTAFVVQAGGDLDAFQKRVETWFDDAMDRVSGTYKRFSQWFSLLFGLSVAIVFNVDTFSLAHVLWTNDASRTALVSLAQGYGLAHADAKPGDDARGQMPDIAAQIDKLPVPLGWQDFHPNGIRDGLTQLWGGGAGIWKIVGWLLTGLAVSLGAPFWFDSLQNLLNLRSAGVKPPHSGNAPAVGGAS